MPEEGDGGTPNTEEKGGEDKVYTEVDVQALVAAAKKEGQTETWQHWQSEADKKVSAARTQFETESKATGEELAGLKKARLDALTPEERSQAMLETVYERLTSPAVKETPADKPNIPDNTLSPGSDSETVTQARGEVGAVLKDMGIDLDKVDWADGVQGPDAMKRFLASVVAQVSDKTKTDLEKEEEEKEASRTESSGKGGSGGFDYMKGDPVDLIKSGVKLGERIRGG